MCNALGSAQGKKVLAFRASGTSSMLSADARLNSASELLLGWSAGTALIGVCHEDQLEDQTLVWGFGDLCSARASQVAAADVVSPAVRWARNPSVANYIARDGVCGLAWRSRNLRPCCYG